MKNFRRFLTISLVLFVLIGTNAAVVSAQTSPTAGETVSAEPNPVNGIFKNSQSLKKQLSVTVFMVILGYLFLFAFIKIINNRVKDIKTRHIVRKNFIYITNFILIVLIFFIWLQNLNSVSIFLGVAGAGLALALQEVVLCIAGWMLILIRHPFETGDRIEINGIKGDVIDVRLFQTSLLEIGNWVDADQSTGRIVNIPNSFVTSIRIITTAAGLNSSGMRSRSW